MKKILTFSILLIFSANLFSQTKALSDEEFKTYTSCDKCFDGWQSSNDSNIDNLGSTNKKNSNNNSPLGNEVKEESKRATRRILYVLGGVIITWFAFKSSTLITQ